MEYIMFNNEEEYPFVEWNSQFIEDYTIFCESDDNLTDDVEEAAPGPYEQWLKLNGYDPKTNTVAINGKRVNVGKIGSNKEKNRRNQFLKRHNFDPKTSTYLSDIPLANGSKARVPLYIGAGEYNKADPHEGTINSPYTSKFNAYRSINDDIINDELLGSTDKSDVLKHLKKTDRDIQSLKDTLNDPEPSLYDMAMRDERQDRLNNYLKRREAMSSYLKKTPRSQRNELAKKQQERLLNTTGISMSTRDLSAPAKIADSNIKHEEGHEETSLNRSRAVDRTQHPGYDYDKAMKFLSEPVDPNNSDPLYALFNTKGRIMSGHDLEPEEHYADIYGVKNNKYIKSKQDAVDTTRRSVDILNNREINNDIKNTKNKIKKVRQEIKAMKADPSSRVLDIEFVEDRLEYLERRLKNLRTYKQRTLNEKAMQSKLRSELLAGQLSDDDFKVSGDPSRRPKTNKERLAEKKAKGELPRKAKKAMKKVQSYKEYMI